MIRGQSAYSQRSSQFRPVRASPGWKNPLQIGPEPSKRKQPACAKPCRPRGRLTEPSQNLIIPGGEGGILRQREQRILICLNLIFQKRCLAVCAAKFAAFIRPMDKANPMSVIYSPVPGWRRSAVIDAFAEAGGFRLKGVILGTVAFQPIPPRSESGCQAQRYAPVIWISLKQ